jgi:2-oxoglutarate dehydrogenase E1 component
LAEKKLSQLIGKYPKSARIVWCQEESQNMGAWTFMEPRLRQLTARPEILYAGRKPSASPAVGALAVHKREQQQLIAAAFSL